MGTITGISRYKTIPKHGFAYLFKTWERFYTRRIFHRLQDCWNRPLCSNPGAHIKVMERESIDGLCTLQTTGRSISCLNLGSYNYLCFADDWKNSCRADVMQSASKWSLSMCSSRLDCGTVILHDELEQSVAKFIGKESAIVYSMGYGTNLNTVPVIMGAESLIISDSLKNF